MNWVQAIGPSLLMLLGGIITWLLKSKAEELRSAEEKLRAERRKLYAQILEPYIRLFADLKGKGAEQATRMISSYDYKKAAFELGLFASDDVLRAYNDLLAHAWSAEAGGTQNPKEMLRLWGKLRLEVRKSLGNKSTKLDEYDMVRGMVRDIDKLDNQ